jgi:predicted Fe-S protein YdhL (DUF1289 family)
MLSSKIESPCQQKCVLDPQSQQCTVCKRTLEQIIDWRYYTPEERKQIIDNLR